ncbi:MAG TPA: bifunctional DNA-formamidopyrimidine glycosylase/DNA-(apurinic or apyrimidinic site) lyase [Pseudonocardiaceae bacterium]
MPELPEVEVVRRGLGEHVVGRRITAVEVRHPRAVRRHLPGAADFAARLDGRTVTAACRRGKYLWLELDAQLEAQPPERATDAVLAHLGMSGQLLVRPASALDETHLRIRLRLDDGNELRFVDQRTFGGFSVEELTADGVPAPVAHIARDPFDPRYDMDAVVGRMRRKNTGLKRALLDQTLISGIGNIYADEALWQARLHWARPTATLTRPAARRLLAAAAEVMTAALGEGGTSFDALYVNVNGQSGYFDRSLAVYGQDGKPCRRCGEPVRREVFMNRSSYSCPRCQPRPRRPHW